MRTTQFLIVILVLIAMIAFLSQAQAIVLPFVLSLFLAFVLLPVVIFFKKYKIPSAIAAVFSLLSAMGFIGVVGYLVYLSLQSLNDSIPIYSFKFKTILINLNHWVEGYGFDLRGLLPEVQSQATSLVGKMANIVMSLSKNGLLIFFITLFMLIEGARFQDKATRAFGEGNIWNSSASQVALEIQQYLLYKTLISLLTGFLVWAGLSGMGVDFPLVWGLLAFVLNFIPTIGSIVASVPPVIIAMVQFESPIQGALAVIVVCGIIQGVVGSYLDPKIMGDHLNLSPLIIFLSMVFWGWLWGPMGMLVAVPLTVCVKVGLRYSQRTKAIAIMMEG